MRTTRFSKPAGFVLAGYLVLLASIALLVWRVLDLRHELQSRAPGVSYQAIENLLHSRIEDSDGEVRRLAEEPKEYLLFFLLSPYDCPICQDELIDLQALHEEIPNLAILAILGHSDPNEARQTRQNYGLLFPVIPDPSGAIIEALAPPETPWKVLVSRRAERILFEDYQSSTPAERKAFAHRVHIFVH